MIEQSLFDYFTTHHFPREEVLNRLPFSVSMDEFWPQLLQLRKARAVELPLKGTQGQTLWFVLTDSLIASGDRIASMARRDIDRVDPCEDMMTEGLMDEAFFTSFVEGASLSRLECRRFLKSGEDPSGVGELLAQNNLSAIRQMTERRYEPYSSRMLLTLIRLLTNAMDGEVENYRMSNTHIIPGRTLVPSNLPPATEVPGMIDSLCLFLNDYEMHPLLKAAIAQAYVLLVRPYDEGNERLARLLSYSILLRKGYSFFRQFALSGMIAQDGMLYYQAMSGLQDNRNGGDLTCFLEYYLGMLSRGVNGFEAYLLQRRRNEFTKKEDPADNDAVTTAWPAENVQKAASPVISKIALAHLSTTELSEQRNRIMAACGTPESLISFVIKWQAATLKIFDTSASISRLGLKHHDMLRTLQKMGTETTQNAVAIQSYLQENQKKTYSCTELANALQIANGTTRRLCYILASLNLIQFIEGIDGRTKRRMLCFSFDEALAS